MPRKRRRAKRESTVTGIAAPAGEGHRGPHEARVEEAAAVVAHQDAVDRPAEARAGPARTARRGGAAGRERGVAVEADDLLLGRVRAAGEDARLHRRRVGRPRRRRPSSAMPFSRSSARSLRPCASRPSTPNGQRPAAEGADVVDGVGAAAQPHVGRVVLQDQDRRLAADPLDAAVDELVGHEVGEDQDAPAGEARGPAPRAARRPLTRASRPRMRSTASSRFSATRSGGRDQPGARYVSSPRPYPLFTSAPRAPTFQASCRSPWRSPITHERGEVGPELRLGPPQHARAAACGSRSPPGRAAGPTDGWCRQA